VTASKSNKACGLEVHEAAEASERQIVTDRPRDAKSWAVHLFSFPLLEAMSRYGTRVVKVL